MTFDVKFPNEREKKRYNPDKSLNFSTVSTLKSLRKRSAQVLTLRRSTMQRAKHLYFFAHSKLDNFNSIRISCHWQRRFEIFAIIAARFVVSKFWLPCQI